MAREPSLQEALNSAFTSNINKIWTAIPCIVVSVDDPNGQIVSIQPTINQRLKDGTVSERTVIRGVPVAFNTSEKSGVVFPINAGVTTGMALFSMRSMESWKSGNGRPTTPNNFAKFDKSDAVFYPGLTPPSNAVSNPSKHLFPHSVSDLTVFHNLGTANEVEFRLREDGSIVVNTNDKPIEFNGSEITFNASESINMNSPLMNVDVQTTTWIGDITLQGNITQVGNYNQTGNYTLIGIGTFNGIPFDTHRHIGVTTGPGTSGGPVA